MRTKRAARADPGAALLVAAEIAPAGCRLTRSRGRGGPVELDVVLGGDPAQHPARRLAQVPDLAELRRKPFHGLPRRRQQFTHPGVALAGGCGIAATLDLVQPVVQCVHQQLAATL